MNHPRTLRRVTVGGVALVSAVVLAACGSGGDEPSGSMNGMGDSSSSSSPQPSSASSTERPSVSGSRAGDVMFAQTMVPHHEQALEMADAALENDSASSRVKALASKIKKAQDPEIKTMKGWLEEWGQPMSASGHDMGDGMMSDHEMADMEAAHGRDFDHMWLTMMVRHHEGAVAMAKEVLGTTKDADVRKLAQSVVDSQTEEIATMEGML
jgi:uncharacterized protein (DUF305 family)